MTGVLVASDLDRTLIYSTSTLQQTPDAATQEELTCVEVYEGRPLSFVTTTAAQHLGTLLRLGVLVPVTSRSREQYARISWPGPAPRLTLCAGGGLLLRDGVEDTDFTAATSSRLAAAGAPYPTMLSRLRRVCEVAGDAVGRVREVDGLFCYAVTDPTRLPDGWVHNLEVDAASHGWRVSVQGRKVYLVPDALSKGAAARAVADLVDADRLLGAGDSLLDQDLLAVADEAIRPAHGELADLGWTAPHVHVTGACGVLAGEQIAAWMAASVSIGTR